MIESIKKIKKEIDDFNKNSKIFKLSMGFDFELKVNTKDSHLSVKIEEIDNLINELQRIKELRIDNNE